MKCKNIKCEKEADKSYGSGEYCSRFCAFSRTHTQETKDKISNFSKGKKRKLLPWSQEYREKRTKLNYEKLIEKIKCWDKSTPNDIAKKLLFIIKPLVCEDCGYSWHNEKSLGPYEVHHINGDKKDNSKENLKILCLNCHWKTPNYRFKGRSHSAQAKQNIRNRVVLNYAKNKVT